MDDSAQLLTLILAVMILMGIGFTLSMRKDDAKAVLVIAGIGAAWGAVYGISIAAMTWPWVKYGVAVLTALGVIGLLVKAIRLVISTDDNPKEF